MPTDDTSASTAEPEGSRPPQHGPEMDDTQVEATGELADTFEPVQPESQSASPSGPRPDDPSDS